MTSSSVDAILRDWSEVVDEFMDPDLLVIANALFLEETFGITLDDADLDPDVIGTINGMRSVLERHVG